MTRRFTIFYSIVTVLALGVVRTASAQEPRQAPRVDAAVSYGVLHDSGSGQTLPASWVGALGLRPGGPVTIVGEASGSYKTDGDIRYRVHTFMGGARFVKAGNEHLLPFAQALVGGACNCGSTVGDGKHTTGLALQVGAGADWELARNVGIRVQADYRNVRISGSGFNQVRLAVGLVVGVFPHGDVRREADRTTSDRR